MKLMSALAAILILATSTTAQKKSLPQFRPQINCDGKKQVTFELLTNAFLEGDTMKNGNLESNDIGHCADGCKDDPKCASANFETGYCSYFSFSALHEPEALVTGDFPVFPVYLEKMCLNGLNKCKNPWSFERVPDYSIAGYDDKAITANTKEECMEACLTETAFICRSAEYTYHNKYCLLSKINRVALGPDALFHQTNGTDYFENGCVEEPRTLCQFEENRGRVLKTVDIIIPNVPSKESCEKLCLQSRINCNYYHYAQLSDSECAISHHTDATLTHVYEPFAEESFYRSYQIKRCYSVKLNCASTKMVASFSTNTLFNGLVYSKSRPETCSLAVNNSLNFMMTIPLTGNQCNTLNAGNGVYSNFIIIQSNHIILTQRDIGIRLSCEFDTSSKTLSGGVNTTGGPTITDSAFAQAPRAAVGMTITNSRGREVFMANIGETLYLKFKVLNKDDAYEIFVSGVTAISQSTQEKIKLIDDKGCPIDDIVLGPVERVDSKTLQVAFEAFKFRNSEQVEFIATIRPCSPKCSPLRCRGPGGEDYNSYGRKRRDTSHNDIYPQHHNDSLLLTTRILMGDSFGTFDIDAHRQTENELCIDKIAIAVTCAIFSAAIISLLAVITFLCIQYKQAKAFK